VIRTRVPDIGHLNAMVRDALELPLLPDFSPPPEARLPNPTPPTQVSSVGDTDFLHRLAEAYYRDVWAVLRRLGVPPEGLADATQHVFLVAASKPEVIRSGSERAFLISIAVRTAANARRARKTRLARQVDEDSANLPGTAPPADELVEQRRLRLLLDRALARLSPEFREPFVLFELEGLTLDEIAETLAIPRGTVASRLRRARELFLAAAKRLEARGSGERP
jgi:RNA polymerase sigma-70 factor, ECF subfamily